MPTAVLLGRWGLVKSHVHPLSHKGHFESVVIFSMGEQMFVFRHFEKQRWDISLGCAFPAHFSGVVIVPGETSCSYASQEKVL